MYNTKNQKTSKNSKRNILVVTAVLISIFLLLFLLEKTGVTNFYSKDEAQQETTTQDSIDYTPPSEEEIKTSEDQKIKNIENSSTTKKIDEKVIIDQAYYDASANELVVKTKLQGLNWTACELTITDNNQEIIKSAKSIYQPEYSTCLGFAVSRSEFNNPGEWTLTLYATTVDGVTSSSEETKVTISP